VFCQIVGRKIVLDEIKRCYNGILQGASKIESVSHHECCTRGCCSEHRRDNDLQPPNHSSGLCKRPYRHLIGDWCTEYQESWAGEYTNYAGYSQRVEKRTLPIKVRSRTWEYHEKSELTFSGVISETILRKSARLKTTSTASIEFENGRT
jgi:hypothetical protein